MKEQNKFAVIGAGSRGLMSYAPYALEHPEEAKIVAVAEPREWFRNEARRLHNIDRLATGTAQLGSRGYSQHPAL